MTEKQLQVLKANQVKKGQVLNPNGKKPGTLSKVNAQVKELLAQAAQDNLPAVNRTIEALLSSNNEATQAKAVELMLRLLEFTQPRLQAVAVKGDGLTTGVIVIGKPQDLDFPALDDDQDNTIDIEQNNLNPEANDY